MLHKWKVSNLSAYLLLWHLNFENLYTVQYCISTVPHRDKLMAGKIVMQECIWQHSCGTLNNITRMHMANTRVHRFVLNIGNLEFNFFFSHLKTKMIDITVLLYINITDNINCKYKSLSTGKTFSKIYYFYYHQFEGTLGATWQTLHNFLRAIK